EEDGRHAQRLSGLRSSTVSTELEIFYRSISYNWSVSVNDNATSGGGVEDEAITMLSSRAITTNVDASLSSGRSISISKASSVWCVSFCVSESTAEQVSSNSSISVVKALASVSSLNSKADNDSSWFSSLSSAVTEPKPAASGSWLASTGQSSSFSVSSGKNN